MAQTGPGPVKTLGSGQSLSNPSGSSITATSGAAVQVNNGAASISNGGLIQATGANGIGIQVVSGGSVATITNTGTIQTTTSGSAIVVGDTIGPIGTIGTLTNSGLIQSTGANAAIQVNTGGSIASIINLASGTIQAAGSGSGIAVAGAIGSVSNSGLIQAATGSGINVAASGSIGSITNNASGVIQATGSGGFGIANAGSIGGIVNAGTIGSILNSGLIVAPLGTAVALGVNGAIPGGITNTATGLIQGGPSSGSGVAIDNSASTNKLTITTAGTVVGQVKLGAFGDTLNVTGGSILGNITGQSGGGNILNFSPTGTFTTGGAIGNVDTINATSGNLVVQLPVTSAVAFNVASGATTVLNANVGALTFNNAGLVNIGSNSPTITGNYVQASSGTLGVTVTGPAPSASGTLNVTGSATIANGSNAVSVHVPTSVDDFALAGSTHTVLTSSGLTVAGGALSASSDNAGISFSLANTSTTLVLTGQQQSSSQLQAAANNAVATIFAPLTSPTPSEVQAQHFLSAAFLNLASTGHIQVVISLDTLLTSLSAAQVLQFNDQLQPTSVPNSQAILNTAISVLSGGESTIGTQLTELRLDPGQTGLAAGDEVGHGFRFWGQPFGAITSQGERDGVDGFDAGTYGITLGGDTLVMPNLRLGAALILSNSNLSSTGSLSGNTSQIFTGEFDLYGQWYLQNNFFIDGLLGAAYNHYSRHNLISALGLALNSDNSGTTLTAKIGAGYDWKLSNNAVLTPYVSLQQFHLNFGSYTTSGGSAYDLDSRVNSQSTDMTQSRVGARFAYPLTLPNGGSLSPEVHAYWLHNFGPNQLTTTYTTADFVSPSTFTSVGLPTARDMIDIGIGVTFLRGHNWSVGGGYDYLGASGLSGHNFYVNLKVDF